MNAFVIAGVLSDALQDRLRTSISKTSFLFGIHFGILLDFDLGGWYPGLATACAVNVLLDFCWIRSAGRGSQRDPDFAVGRVPRDGV